MLPYLYASIDPKNDCCGDSAAFSPDHQLTILVFVVMCLGAYFYSSYRKKLSTPVIEIILNCLLVFGIVFNIVIALQTNQLSLALGGNLPIILLTILVLVKNQRLFLERYSQEPNHHLECFKDEADFKVSNYLFALSSDYYPGNLPAFIAGAKA